MSRAILDSSADAPPMATTGFADLQPLDQELASQLPAWDLVPPHTFLVRKARKPKPVAAPQLPEEIETPAPVAIESQPVEQNPVAEATAVEIEAEPAALAPEDSEPEPLSEIDEEAPATNLEAAAEADPSPAAQAENCSSCGFPLEPGSAFCAECGHKQ